MSARFHDYHLFLFFISLSVPHLFTKPHSPQSDTVHFDTYAAPPQSEPYRHRHVPLIKKKGKIIIIMRTLATCRRDKLVKFGRRNLGRQTRLRSWPNNRYLFEKAFVQSVHAGLSLGAFFKRQTSFKFDTNLLLRLFSRSKFKWNCRMMYLTSNIGPTDFRNL